MRVIERARVKLHLGSRMRDGTTRNTKYRADGPARRLPAPPEKLRERSLHELCEWMHDLAEAGGAPALHRLFTAESWPGTPQQRAALFGTYVRLVKGQKKHSR
jgi:hypothetical protein